MTLVQDVKTALGIITDIMKKFEDTTTVLIKCHKMGFTAKFKVAGEKRGDIVKKETATIIQISESDNKGKSYCLVLPMRYNGRRTNIFND